ncbi:Multicopper oxidase type 2 [Penicillium mononematosum]|uniref:Multicopper oxidase type 2 n=1 Tax=Penicillium mononematosum TaxID=268346 RepID=UPI002547377A|nr:Multicopper oxidase type 2 [Penicillium mononematosum]KAJ6185437.1 Multicopper oxidase type 2 [Penicillium mononematosum]
MPFNTAIHFHGIEQRNTPWSDGVPGLTQSISNQDIAGHIVGPPPSTVLAGIMPCYKAAGHRPNQEWGLGRTAAPVGRNATQPCHPSSACHAKHSNKGFIFGVGPGIFNWSSTEEAYAEHPEFSLESPLMRDRDTFFTNGPNGSGPTWMIVRYRVVNPGPFLFHYHIHTNMANGVAVALLDGIDACPQAPESEHRSPRPWSHS